MTKLEKFRVWEYYYSVGKFDWTCNGYNTFFPCCGVECEDCEMSLKYRCSFRPEENGLTSKEVDEFYNLHPEYKIIS